MRGASLGRASTSRSSSMRPGLVTSTAVPVRAACNSACGAPVQSSAETSTLVSSTSRGGSWPKEHVALQMTLFLNQQLVQIRNLLGFITLAILFFLLAINSYPFQPHGLLGLYAMTVFASALIAAVTVLVQIDKDPVLSRIAGTTPNKLDRSIILPVLTYAVLPFLGMLATQFPELSGISSGAASALRGLH
jgi:hypothetical protein